jgi:hypothetical protein
MIKYTSIVLTLLGGFISWGCLAQAFPPLEGENLSGQQITIPADISDKVSLVGMAYSKKSEDALKSWYQPMYDKFVLKRGIWDSNYDINLLFVPMFTGAKKMAYEQSMNKMKESNRKDLYPYLLFYKGNLEPYVTDLDMNNKALPYLFLLGKNGEILWSTKGIYTPKKIESIEEILDALQ